MAELQAWVTTEVEVGRFGRDEQASVANLGLWLGEARQLTAALQAEVMSRLVTVAGKRHRLCATYGCVLASKGYDPAAFRALFGGVPVRVRRLLVCPYCQSLGESGAGRRRPGVCPAPCANAAFRTRLNPYPIETRFQEAVLGR